MFALSPDLGRLVLVGVLMLAAIVPVASGAVDAGNDVRVADPTTGSPAQEESDLWKEVSATPEIRSDGSGISVSVDARVSESGGDDPTVGTIEPEWGVAAVFSTVALAAARFGPRVLSALGPGIGGIPLYSRIDADELLENETRAELYGLIQEEPGLSMQELSDRTGNGWGTVVYHLERLEENDYVMSRPSGNARRFYTTGDIDSGEAEIMALLQEDTPGRIVRTLLEEPGLNGRELADRLDLAPSTVSKHVTRLQDAEIVSEDPDGGQKNYFVDGLPREGRLLPGDAPRAAGQAA